MKFHTSNVNLKTALISVPDEAAAEAPEALGGLLASAELGALLEGLAGLCDCLECSFASLLAAYK